MKIAQGEFETVRVARNVEFFEDVQHSLMLVKCEEMQAGGASIKHLATLVECMFHADAVHLARIARGFQTMCQLARYFKPGKLAQLRQPSQRGNGHNTGDNGHLNPGKVRSIHQPRIALGLKENLGDGEIRPGTLF